MHFINEAKFEFEKQDEWKEKERKEIWIKKLPVSYKATYIKL
jgi:hypothetical protein